MQKHIKKNKLFYILLALVVICSLIPVIYLFNTGFFLSDDGEWMIIRFSAFYQTLREGQIPPRFFGRLNHGYGYPIGVFLYPAFMYLAAPFKIMGLSFSESVKAVIISSFIFSGIGSFLWLRFRFSLLAAFIGSLVYLFFPYHLYDLYVRGSVGELVAFGVLPFLLLTIEKKKIIFGSFLYALLILSHNTFAFLLTPVLLIYTYFQHSRSLFGIYFFGVLLSIFFWLPSITELQLTRFNETAISEWQTYFLTPQSVSLIGFISAAVAVTALYALYKRKDRVAVLFAIVFFFSLFLASPLSTFLWHFSILPKLVQFPWRLLIITLLSASFLTAYTINLFSGIKQKAAISVFVLLVIISALPMLKEYKPILRDDGYYATNEDTTSTRQEYMPKWVKKIPLSHPEAPVNITQGNGTIRNLSQNSYRTQFTINASTPATIVIHKIYYPGWLAEVNGQSQNIDISSEGYLELSVPRGTSDALISFAETPLRLFSDVVSLSSATLLFCMLFIPRKIARAFSKWYNSHVWKRK